MFSVIYLFSVVYIGLCTKYKVWVDKKSYIHSFSEGL